MSVQEKNEILFQDEKSYQGHTHWVNSCLYFSKPYDKIVSCSSDCKIRIWSAESCETDSILEHHSNFVRQIIKWSNDVFISCSNDCNLFAISMEPPYKIIKKHKADSGIYKLLKLNDELILFLNSESEMIIISYKSFSFFKKIESQQHMYNITKLVKSKVFPNCFYMNADEKTPLIPQKPVKLIDYEQNKVLLLFQDHIEDETIWGIEVYKNPRKEEILVYGGSKMRVYFYNVGMNNINNNEVKDNNKKKMKTFKVVQLEDMIRYFYGVGSYYLFVTSSNGYVCVLDLRDEEFKILCRKKIHERPVVEVQVFSDDKLWGKDEKRMLSCSYDRTCKFHKVVGLENEILIDGFEKKDLEERKLFLWEERELFCFGEEEVKFMKITLRNKSLENIFKSFMMM